MTSVLGFDQIEQRLADLPAWRCFDRSVRARFIAPDFSAGIELVREVALAAERADHHPDIDIRWRTVSFELSTHSEGGVTEQDLMMARQISALAAGFGATAQAIRSQRVEFAVDTLDAERIRPFWAAVFAAEPVTVADGSIDLLPSDGGPRIWFQPMSQAREGRNRLHIDLYLPRTDIPARLAAAVAAGGRLVTEEFAPSWWVLADADGNEVCLCVPDE